MELIWLVIPAAVAIFVARTALIAWRLRRAAEHPTLADVEALREAKQSLGTHRKELDEAVRGAKGHLEAAKRLAGSPERRS